MPWERVRINSEILAIHAALLPLGQKGKILFFGGSEHWKDQFDVPGGLDHTRLFDIDTGNVTTLPSPTTDVFCAGHAFLADGRLIVVGGTKKYPSPFRLYPKKHLHDQGYPAERACWLYLPNQEAWEKIADLNLNPAQDPDELTGGRWYPTPVTLANGDILAMYGHTAEKDKRHLNDTPELYSLRNDTWTLLDAIPGTDELGWKAVYLSYPRLHLLPNGTVFFSSRVPGDTVDNISSQRMYDVENGVFEGPQIIRPSPDDDIHWHRWNGQSVLLPLLANEAYRPRVLVTGGKQPQWIDLDPPRRGPTPFWRNTASRSMDPRERKHACIVFLPTGKLFLSGGIKGKFPHTGGTRHWDLPQDKDAVQAAEIYDPGIDFTTGTYTGADSWTTVEAAFFIRNYHSTALLMPDGRVWTAGSNIDAHEGDPNVVGVKEIEIYRPDYFDDVNRPEITSAPPSLSYGQSFEIEFDSHNNDQIQNVALIRMGSVTHAFDFDQRYVSLGFTENNGRLTATTPPNGNIAPPGYYMLWIVDENELPCQLASFVRVANQNLSIVVNRPRFSKIAVQNLQNARRGSPPPGLAWLRYARFEESLTLVFEGFLERETNEDIEISFIDSRSGQTIEAMYAEVHSRTFEDFAQRNDVSQRITMELDIIFKDTTPFDILDQIEDSYNYAVSPFLPVTVRVTHGPHTSDATISLFLEGTFIEIWIWFVWALREWARSIWRPKKGDFDKT